MSTFGRKFPMDCLSAVVLGENAWLCDMLAYWRPAGDQIGRYSGQQLASQALGQLKENPKHLRLAIRNGYVNFYRGGQSVAKVDVDRRGKPRARIHNKYVYGNEGKGKDYVTLTST